MKDAEGGLQADAAGSSRAAATLAPHAAALSLPRASGSTGRCCWHVLSTLATTGSASTGGAQHWSPWGLAATT